MPTKEGAKSSHSLMSLRSRLREYPRNGTIPCGNERTQNASEIRQESKGVQSAGCGIYRRRSPPKEVHETFITIQMPSFCSTLRARPWNYEQAWQ